MSRREARALEAERARIAAADEPSAVDSSSEAPTSAAPTSTAPTSDEPAPDRSAGTDDRPASPADAPIATRPEELHPEVAALLTGELPTETEAAAGGSGSDGTDDRDATGGGGAAGGGGRGGRGGGGRASRPPREPRPKRRRGPLVAGIVIVAVVLAAGVGAYTFAAPKIQQLVAAVSGAQEPDDYTGDGTTKVTITIKQGDIGENVAATLQRSGVVKDSKVFYKLLLASPDVQFQPGSYALKKEMSSKSALAALQDEDNRVQASIIIPEGTALADIKAGMVSKAGLTKKEVDAAAKDLAAYDLPSGVTTLEGWLFPATYPINPGWTAEQYFASMVDTMKEHLAAAGVKEADQERTIVFASLVQKEAGLAADYPKVARVFQNRLDQGMKLQSDATVAYGTGNTHTVTTTDAERADASNEYNTYVHEGLPPAPISNPGDIAIKAVTAPASGKWLYFVTVDLESGETVFSDTYDQHLVAVERFQAWLRAHPDYQ
ncbi:endolytic transglycosylase MltG [Curtobacterium flaccumfaciens pv. flaccumfaciens]|uniref:Endolytic murein transglycosylase n=2 Tax=Curtobacterium aurantiacum TaxID=3236919 RepID=A0ABS5VHY2_9MICO|nr:endolytic transglycosylase MltG [Curtobacterium flaccumfaciens pv. flaccumfaciens]MBT1589099.1 endolytic transglycosylase MltG [Curtobacterium flaccumfaciens pv. flaccumfaciens]